MKTFAVNKRALFNYQVLEKVEAGIMLTGPEVKSVRAGHISLKEAFATLMCGELWLTNAHVSPYKPANNEDYEPNRSRKLLLSKKEIIRLGSQIQAGGVSLVPLRVYDKNGKIKIELGLGRGKKKYDKRETIKKREQEREIARAVKNRK